MRVNNVDLLIISGSPTRSIDKFYLKTNMIHAHLNAIPWHVDKSITHVDIKGTEIGNNNFMTGVF